jgi:hypothetical protein
VLVLVGCSSTFDDSELSLFVDTKIAFHVPLGTCHEVVRLNFPFGHAVAAIVDAKRGLARGSVELPHAIAVRARTARYLFTIWVLG